MRIALFFFMGVHFTWSSSSLTTRAECIDGNCQEGTVFLSDGKKATGNFIHDRLDGIGTMTWPDGRKENVEQTDERTYEIVVQ